MAGRRIFVGDLQGCSHELEDLLVSVAFDRSVDRLYSVGDAINRGPDSAGCVRLLREFDATMVLGNHELHLFEVLAGRRQESGRDTLASLTEAHDGKELIEWLRQRPLLHVEEDVVMVHAALHPTWTDLPMVVELLEQKRQILDQGLASSEDPVWFATTARYCDEHGRRPKSDWPPPEPPFVPWDDHYAGPRTVVFGHWARRGLVNRPLAKGLDTGCVYGKQLTAWIAEEDRLVSVDARRSYCSTSQSPGQSSRG